MNTKELLEKHPKTTKLIKEWFTNKMLESFENKGIPEQFKEYMREQTIENESLIPIIDGNLRVLFDLFDDNEIYIETNIQYAIGEYDTFIDKKNIMFSTKINNESITLQSTRKKAEKITLEIAFELLEEKL